MAIINFIYWSNVQGVGLGGTRIPPLPDITVGVTSPYIHIDLEAGLTYYYVIAAYDTETAQYSVASNEGSGMPLAPPNTTGQIVW